MAGNGCSEGAEIVDEAFVTRMQTQMQRESFAAVKNASTFPTGVLKTRWCFSADRGDQVVWISNYRHRLRLLLDVLNLCLSLLLCSLSCLLLSLLLCSLRLCLGLSLHLRLLLLNHRANFVGDDCCVGRIRIQSTMHQSIMCIELCFRCESFAARKARKRSFTGVSSRKGLIVIYKTAVGCVS